MFLKNQLSKKQKFSKKTEKTGILIPLWNLNRTNLKNVLEKDPYLKNNFKMLPFSLSVHNINIFSFQGLSDPIQNRQNCQLPSRHTTLFRRRYVVDFALLTNAFTINP